jgi:hypothetical protein
VAGIPDIQVIPAGQGPRPQFPSTEEAGRSLILVAGFIFPVDDDGQDFMVALDFPPTLPSLSAMSCPTLVSNQGKKGVDTG